MRIKKLEIFGFKSFADRITIHFDQGVTGIVGPNGCGKSNVVDALRWVMGEQNAKHLRGDNMQDIIFNGSQNKGPMGLAEVTLTLENDGHLIPTEYLHFDEIEVTRRLYRNGNSEYEINKRPCRLRDITEFFLGTGVGTKAYSIIEQGRVSSLVQAKPEERRQIIEEAAGITKYKMRRLAAERKMESTQQNLLRIQDITKEVVQRLNSLEKQAQKAEHFQTLHSQVRHLELHEASTRFFEHTNLLNFLRDQRSSQETLLETHTDTLSTQESALQSEREVLQDLESKLALTQNLIHAVDNTIALAKQDIQFTQTTLASKQKQTLYIHDELKRLETRLTQLNQEAETLADQKSALASNNSNLQQQTQEASRALQELTQTRSNKHQTQSQLQSKILQASREATSAQASINQHTGQREQAKARAILLEQELAQLGLQLESGDSQKAELRKDINSATQHKEAISSEVKALETELSKLSEEITQTQGLRQQNSQLIASKQGRLSALKDALLESIPAEHGELARVAEEIDIPEAFESLVEDACSERLAAFRVSSLSKGLQLSAHGRLRFFSGGIEALKFEIVKNTEEALKRWDKARADGVILLTESGELFDTDHSCVAGERSKDAGLLAQKREIQTLEAELVALESQAKTLQELLDTLTLQRSKCEQKLHVQRAKLQEASLQLARLEEGLKAKESQEKHLRTRIDTIHNECAKLKNNPSHSDENLKKIEDQWAVALEVHEKLQNDLATLQQELVAFEANYSIQSESLTTLRIESASSQERVNQLIRLEQQNRQNLDDIKLQNQNLEKQLKDIAEDEFNLHKQAKLAQIKVVQSEQELKTLQQNKELEQQACQKQKASLAQSENFLNEKRRAVDTLQKTLSKLSVEIRESELALESLHQRLFEKYRVKPVEILHDYHHLAFDFDGFEKTLRELTRQIEHLGPINQGAIQEFEELKTRHEFLSTQSRDLQGALEQLATAIQKINETTMQRFEEAFNAINDKFAQVFPRLFRGGKAWLQLTEPTDLLNTGVEIFAQPPGKKLASIALMSGGEKALTATSLIFAIFLIKPSPFCLLDEVDAPLDEANVERFSQMVKEMSAVSQFIVITHNKRTMEKADQLYGITMEKAGISKTVNVQVKDAPSMAASTGELALA